MPEPGPVGVALKRFIEPEGPWSMRRLSAEAGLSEKAVQMIINGISHDPRGGTVRRLASALHLPVQSLLDGSASPRPSPAQVEQFMEPNLSLVPHAAPPEPRRFRGGMVPVMGTAAAGDDGFFEINLTEGGVVEYIDLPPALAHLPQGDLFAIRVQGASMSPLWRDNDVVHIVKSRRIKPGDAAVVMIEHGPGQPPRALLKEFVGQDSKTTVLKQLNPMMEVEIPRRKVRNLWAALHWRDLQ